jgi:hypothetical protein
VWEKTVRLMPSALRRLLFIQDFPHSFHMVDPLK